MFVVLSVILYFVLFLFFRTFYSRKEKSLLPTNWPILGMTPAVLQNIGRIHEFVTEFLQKNGGTFLLKGPWFSNIDMLITCDPANVHYILTKNFQNFGKGPEFKKIFDILGEGIFIAESESWKNQRKIAKSIIKDTSFQDFVATTSLNKVKTSLIPILERVSEMGTQVDIQELFQRFTFDCACIFMLGHDLTSLCHELPDLPYAKAFNDVEKPILHRHILPEIFWKLQKWLHIGTEDRSSRAKEILNIFMWSCMSSNKQKNYEAVHAGEMESDMLTRYMRKVSEKRDDVPEIHEEVLKDLIFNLIIAAKSTTSASLTWFFWLLATNPEEEKKIREEILMNLRLIKEADGNWKIFGDDINKEVKSLTYLHAALCESLRLFPPVALQHKAPLEHDVLPSGHRIKPNTKTILSFYSMGRMKSIWGEDCLEFKPQRWISESGRIKPEPSYKFTAFNAGPRTCLGKEMSLTQMKIVAASIISRFKIQVVEGHPIAMTTTVNIHMKYGLKVEVSSYVGSTMDHSVSEVAGNCV